VKLRVFLASGLFLLTIWGSYRAAMRAWAGHLVQYDPTVENLQLAATILPDNPTIYRLLGRNYLDNPNLENPLLAEKMLHQAVNLAPQRYQNWLLYARAQETTGNLEGAEQSLQRALTLAPQYYDCYWQYAHFLARQARPKEALAKLKQALARDATQLDYALDLGWQLSAGDLTMVETLLPVASSSAKASVSANVAVERSYLEFLLRQELYLVAAQRLRPELMTDDRYVQQIRELINRLINRQQYIVAHQCWQQLPEANVETNVEANIEANVLDAANAISLSSTNRPITKVQNGDFGAPLVAGQTLFNWQFKSTPTAKLSLDRPTTTGHSLRIDYKIEQNEEITHLEQLILVAPQRKYQLRYSTKSEDLIGGSMPVIEIRDPQGNLLARSQPPLERLTDWTSYQFSFSTSSQLTAIYLRVRRDGQCSVPGPCPIAGQVWFSDFQLQVSP
jgi:tetratricopeptide (TPR) repeat protein